MTIFSEPWSGAFEALPADNENISPGAGEIRNLKRDIREREMVDHSWTGDVNDGKHLWATLMRAGAKPVIAGTDGAIYTKLVAGHTELFYENEAGVEVQLTSQGSISSPNLLAQNNSAGNAWTGLNQVNKGVWAPELFVALVGGILTLDFSLAINFLSTPGGNFTMANPINVPPSGQSCVIRLGGRATSISWCPNLH